MIAIAILFTSSRNTQKENNGPVAPIPFRLTSEVLLDRLGQFIISRAVNLRSKIQEDSASVCTWQSVCNTASRATAS